MSLKKSSKSKNRGKPTTMKVALLEASPNFRLTSEKKQSIFPTEEEKARWIQRMITNVQEERKREKERKKEEMNEAAGSKIKRPRRRHRRTRHKGTKFHKKHTKHKRKRGTQKRHQSRFGTRKKRRRR